MSDQPFNPTDTDAIPALTNDSIALRDVKRRTAEVDRMYDTYVAYMRKPTVVPYEVFRKYEVLYRKETLAELEDPTKPDNSILYHKLLTEFIKTVIVNPYKEYYVLMPNGEYIAFPPLLNPVASLSQDKVEVIDTFFNISDRNHDKPWKLKHITSSLLKDIYASQNLALIQYQQNKTTELVSNMRKIANNKPGQTSTTATTTNTDDGGALDGMEFVLDE